MPLYLRIADELYLKRLLVGGLERVYEIGHDFRNEGMDRTHNPEFTMLEFYQAYADYTDMMTLTEALVAGVIEHCLASRVLERGGVTLDFTPPFRRVSFIDGVRERCGLDLRTAPDEEMRRALVRAGEPADAVASAERRQAAGRGVQGGARAAPGAADLRARLPQAALAARQGAPQRPRPHRALRAVRRRPRAGERVQRAQRSRRPAAAVRGPGAPARRRETRRPMPSTPTTSGRSSTACLRPAAWASGIDRLMMVIADRPSIRDVILYPAMRPEEG